MTRQFCVAGRRVGVHVLVNAAEHRASRRRSPERVVHQAAAKIGTVANEQDYDSLAKLAVGAIENRCRDSLRLLQVATRQVAEGLDREGSTPAVRLTNLFGREAQDALCVGTDAPLCLSR